MIVPRLAWAAALIALLYPLGTSAVASGWRPTPQLTGEGICALVTAGGLTWAGGIGGGLYLSRDGGASWHSRPVPESQLPACPLAVSPAYGHDHLILAVTDRAYASTDGGRTWSPLSLPVTPSALAFSPSFATDGTIVAATDAGPVYRSIDRGTTWTQVADWQAGLPAAGHFIVYGATVLPDASVWLATSDGVYRSLDGGTTWAWANAGLPTTQDVDPMTADRFTRVQRVAAIADDGGDLLAALFASGRGWIYRSTDAGMTWTKVGRTLQVRPSALGIAPGSSEWLLGTHEAGVLESTNGGASWAPLGTDLGDDDIAAIAAPAPQTILAGGSYDGVFRLNLAAAVWKSGFTGMPQEDVAAALAPSTRGVVYAGTLSGVYRLAAGTWRPDNAGLPGERSVAGFAALRRGTAHVLFAATASGVYYRLGSEAWHQVGAGPMRGVAAAAIAARGGSPGTILAATENGLYWSTDGAGQWRLYAAGEMYVSQLAFSPAYGQDHTIYALSNGRLKRYRGRHGTVIRDYIGSAPILTFAVQPGMPRSILAATATALYQGIGTRWRRIVRADLGPAPVIDFVTRWVVLVGSARGLLVSRDAGGHWRRVPTPGGAGVSAIARESGGRAVISLVDGGVWHFALS